MEEWKPRTHYVRRSAITLDGKAMKCVAGGTSGNTPPVIQEGKITVRDGSILWRVA
jgi:hypothetical protein